MFGGKIMDNFMDKLAQKLNAQEMIKANSAAEAMEMRKLQAQVEEYEKMLQEMKKVNLKNIELTDSIEALTKGSLAKIEECQAKNTDYSAVIEEIGLKTGDLKAAMEASFKKADEYIHTENVKVYRNVQAVVMDGLKEQTTTLIEAQDKNHKKTGAILPLVLIGLILVMTDLALNILQIFNIL